MSKGLSTAARNAASFPSTRILSKSDQGHDRSLFCCRS